MNEQEAMNRIVAAMADETPLNVTINISEAWLLVSAIQSLTRNPGLGDPTKERLVEIAMQLADPIIERHPQSEDVLEMGWNPAYDVEQPATPQTDTSKALMPVNNCWHVHLNGSDEAGDSLAFMGRPQDWGDPKWMYRVYTLEAQGYRNVVHCWVDQQVGEFEHLQSFAGLVCSIMLPGWPVWKSGRDYLDQDDFWQPEWGEQPPYHDEPDEEL